jgi:GNAT superfamily N-acetyltransferase
MSARDQFTSRPSGDTIQVRLVSPEDRKKLGRMLSRLSVSTIYERFHVPYPRVPGWALAGMLEADHHGKEALVAVAEDEIVGHAMYARTGNKGEAEFAAIVEDGWQSRGVGKLLLSELAAVARSRGIGLFTGSVLGENRRALGALAAVYPGMRYEIRNGSYLVRVPLRALPHEATGESAA